MEPMVSWIAVRKRVAIKQLVKPGGVCGDLQKVYTIGVLLIGKPGDVCGDLQKVYTIGVLLIGKVVDKY